MSARSDKNTDSDPDVVSLAVDRAKALTRAVSWGVPAVLVSIGLCVTYRNLHFRPTGVTNRLVDYSLALALVPLGVIALACGVQAVRWLGLGLWPDRLGIDAGSRTLALHLGTFGRREYDARRLTIRYPFEQPDEEGENGYEAYLPEEQQLADLLPEITHPDAGEPLNQTILRYTAETEANLAKALRPIIERWRQPGP